ncbi:MAG: cytochrome b/b6 domain-containing protein [Colwellia sp.]|jgi:Cytochrome b
MSQQFSAVFVWSRNIRLFHWVNVSAVLLLIVIGLIILNSKVLGVSVDGKILLKTIHVYIGYVFVLNLLIRIILGFVGKNYERWSKTLPFQSGFTKELKDFTQGRKTFHQGHNPAGKLMVAAFFFFLSVQMVSGLVVAGTDIYYPPFGQYFAESIAIDKTDLNAIKPYSKTNVDEEAYKAMRAFRKPFITAHVYSFYTLLFLIPLHILGVIFTERKERTSVLSAMINGYKHLPTNKKE